MNTKLAKNLAVGDFFSYADDRRMSPAIWKVLAIEELGEDAVRILTITRDHHKRITDCKKNRVVEVMK